jgi:hypothetical protein
MEEKLSCFFTSLLHCMVKAIVFIMAIDKIQLVEKYIYSKYAQIQKLKAISVWVQELIITHYRNNSFRKWGYFLVVI